MKTNHWYTVRRQSLATYVSNVGFDLALYEGYSEPVQEELKKRAIAYALWEIRHACEEQGFDFSKIKNGVYVISLSNPLSIKYRRARSQVIYIGLGNISGRIKTHFNRSLFDFMLSLSGADFDFHFALPKRKGPSKDYYKHVEYCMLQYFSTEYGGMDEKRQFPILNKNAGSNRNFKKDTQWWSKPLKAGWRRPKWELRPTNFSDFAPLDSKSEK